MYSTYIPTVTFENVCRVHTKRQVIIKMNKFNMFITAVCVLFLIRDFPQTKLDSVIQALFLLNEHGDPHFLFYKFNENNIRNN